MKYCKQQKILFLLPEPYTCIHTYIQYNNTYLSSSLSFIPFQVNVVCACHNNLSTITSILSAT